MAGLIGAVLAGGAAGLGTGMAQVGQQQAKFLDEQSLEQMRSELAMQREQTLEALRSGNRMKEAEHGSGLRRDEAKFADKLQRDRETDPELAAGKRRIALDDAQAKIDLETNPDNVSKTAKREGLIQRAKSENTAYDLAPGQERRIGADLLASNKRMTSAEATLAAYREGLRGGRGGSGSSGPKLPEAAQNLYADLDKDESELRKAIGGLQAKKLAAQEKASADPLNGGDDKKMAATVQRIASLYDPEITKLSDQLAEISRGKMQILIDHDQIKPDFIARKATLSKDPATVRQVIDDSYTFGEKWGAAVKAAVDATGFMQNLEADASRKTSGLRAMREAEPAAPAPGLIEQVRQQPTDGAARPRPSAERLAAQHAEQTQALLSQAQAALGAGDRQTLTRIQGSRYFSSLPLELRRQIYSAVNR